MAFDPSVFEESRRKLFNQFGQQAALTAYQKYLAETRGQRPIVQLEEAAFGFTPTGKMGDVPALTRSYARRGLTGISTRSGVYNRALQSYAKERAKQLGYAKEDLAGTMRGYDLAQAQGLASYEQGIADLEALKARQIAADAQALLNLRQDNMAFPGEQDFYQTYGGRDYRLINAETNRLKYILDAQKAIDEQNAAIDAINRARTGAANQAEYLQTLLGQGAPQKLIDLVGGQKDISEQYVKNQYDELMKQLAESYGRGEQLTKAGYDALATYLTQNQPTAFTQATRAQAAPVRNDLAQYMAGQGVSTAPVEPTITALQQAAQGGAQNYNELLNTLAKLQQSGQQSRMSEAEMARTVAGTQLAQSRASQEGSLQQQKLAALADVQAKAAAERLTLEREAAARQQAIEDTLASLVGTGYVCPPGKVKDANGNCITPPKTNDTSGDNIDPEILKGLENFKLDLGNIGGFVGSL